ncbi:palmitoyltransferase ZDHHC2 isoform X2 [Leguminivora glycinivorella]|uniref:palmitoyltransferase ZDHHC2 isoform X2 n=1 Tax=Leguminivora glycinivorella TaxID=1035111 RepID=UPI00200CF4C8|nr:palmitoyltransferase ZDHHC2 isoform X2 [Leguminivora glycinivorella]
MASSVQNNRASPSGYCMCCRVCNNVCWRAFKWIPVLLIVSIITWSYYAYVIQLCIFTIESTVQQVLYLIVYHIVLFMFAWSYCRTIFAQIEPIPEKFKLPEEEIERLLSADSEEAQRQILDNFAKDLPIVTRTMSGSVRYCNRCVLVKPDRAHHCSLCGRCVLKMDHHCPWVNNCVCFHNYKFFMLFLGYALVYCTFVMATCLPYFIKFWRGGDFGNAANAGRYHIVFAFFVALMFGISLGSLFGYHCYLVATNRTTLEAFRAPMFRGGVDKNGFSIGAYGNFKEVFGNQPCLWLVPVFTSFGDGIAFPLPIPEEDTESLLSSERWDRWGERARPFDERESSSFDEL